MPDAEDRKIQSATSPEPDKPALDPRKGTKIMPMPSQNKVVAGQPRAGRAVEQPGEPGVITAEDDVLDTSKTKPDA